MVMGGPALQSQPFTVVPLALLAVIAGAALVSLREQERNLLGLKM